MYIALRRTATVCRHFWGYKYENGPIKRSLQILLFENPESLKFQMLLITRQRALAFTVTWFEVCKFVVFWQFPLRTTCLSFLDTQTYVFVHLRLIQMSYTVVTGSLTLSQQWCYLSENRKHLRIALSKYQVWISTGTPITPMFFEVFPDRHISKLRAHHYVDDEDFYPYCL
jgi:hypothetical protein